MTYNGWGGLGQGQRVTKREGPQSESWLVVRQALIGAAAIVALTVLLVMALLVVGRGAAIILGVIAAYKAAAIILSWEFKPTVREPYKWRLLALAILAAMLAIWLVWLGPTLVAQFWPDWRYINNRLWINGRSRLRITLWTRLFILIALAGLSVPLALLAIRMGSEIRDPNWPPVYQQRDPTLGPWNPVTQNTGEMVLTAVPEGQQEPDHHERENWMTLTIPHGDGNGVSRYKVPPRPLMSRIAREMQSGRRQWSVRGLSSIPGIGTDRAQMILGALENAGLIEYPQGRNDPGGGQLTAHGRQYISGLINQEVDSEV